DYDIRVYASGGGNDVVPYTVVGNATFDIDLKGATARGVVLDATTGVPLSDVRIYVVPASQAGSRVWRNATTDSDGRFVLETLPDGTFTLRAEREHYAAALQSITVSGGGTPPIELRLARGQEAVVRLVDSETGASPGQRMPFNSLAPGVYEVDRVSDDGKTLLQKYSVVLTAGQTANLDVE